MVLTAPFESGIYCIINAVNSKRYVGSAVSLSDRWSVHLSSLRMGKHHNPHLQNAFIKYGEKSFSFEILEYVEDLNDLIKIEQYYIDWLDTCNNEIGYNISPTAGNCFGIKRSQETRARVSRAKLGANHPLYGKCGKDHPSYGQQRSKEAKEKMSRSHMGQIPWNKGGTHSDATKIKLSRALRGNQNARKKTQSQ